MDRKFFEVKVKHNGVNPSSMTIEGMASFKEVDRMGDLMLPTAFDDTIKTFMKNPVFAWCHNIMTIPPLGKIVEFEVREDGPHFKAKFDHDPFSKLVFSKYRSGSMRAFSVQFIPDEVRDATDEEKGIYGASLKRVIVKAQLLEISAVPVPAVANALVGKSMTDFDIKSFMKMTKEVTDEGDTAGPSGDKRNLHERIEAAMELVAQLSQLLAETLEAAGEKPDEADDEVNDETGDEGPDGGSGHDEDEEVDDERVLKALDDLDEKSKQLEQMGEVSA